MSPLKDMRWNCIHPGVATGFMRSGSLWTITRVPPYFGWPHPTLGLPKVESSHNTIVRRIIHRGFAQRMGLTSLQEDGETGVVSGTASCPYPTSLLSKSCSTTPWPPKELPREVRPFWRRVRSVLARVRSVLKGVLPLESPC